MNCWKSLSSLYLCLTILSGCQKSPQSSNLPQDKFIQAYFNHRETNPHTYTDPYRQIEREGDNLEEIIIKEISAAQSSIDLAVQEINLPLIARALVKSHLSGVKVRVILENNYSRSLSRLKPSQVRQLNRRDRLKYEEYLALVDRNRNGNLSSHEISQGDALVILKEGGISVIDDTADGSKGSGLMHHKFLVIDGKTVVTGSANFTLSGIHGDFKNPDSKGNINHLLKINNPKVARLFLEEFNYMWGQGEAGGINSKFGLAKPWREAESISWHDTQVTLQFAPTSATKSWDLSSNGSIGKAINSARNSLDLALFVFSDQAIANILQQKQEQKVEIKGIFDSDFAFRYYSEVLDLLGVAIYRRCQAELDNNPWTNPLKKVGVAKTAAGDKLHHKFALIDDRTVISGSHNWSQAANNVNDETLIVIRNFTLAQHFAQEFKRLSNQTFWGLPSSIQKKLQSQGCD